MAVRLPAPITFSTPPSTITCSRLVHPAALALAGAALRRAVDEEVHALEVEDDGCARGVCHRGGTELHSYRDDARWRVLVSDPPIRAPLAFADFSALADARMSATASTGLTANSCICACSMIYSNVGPLSLN